MYILLVVLCNNIVHLFVGISVIKVGNNYDRGVIWMVVVMLGYK